MKIFEVESKLETNLKQLEFYYELFDKLESKYSFLIVIYSFIFLYTIELFKFFIEVKFLDINIIFTLLFALFVILLTVSLVLTYQLQKPIDIYYTHEPNYYYNDILNEYKKKLNIGDDINEDQEYLLNEYVNITYLQEQEIALSKNIKAYRSKRKKYYHNFNVILVTLILYVITSSFVIFEKRKENNSFDLKNYKEIINYLNSSKDGR
ncbi:hypothetical protein DRF59_11265 [Chryseobacterium flavum]|uniref:SMODS and SLOG-associating 2TM effector domain-containing protein n=1 Tax=Chryseobacterium flavum TaxID=415851 RepID=A0A3D9CM66_9FLAO|nr:hypothetical protein [Chryseobacterium flavum]REC66876.1 hypothetical protein DRF59_11265 [Chryseobacterium flavum]